jgi:G:T-mismatch repair DNA endonuclease (very short patch repair protein)
MYEWRKSLHWENAICLNCKNQFKRRKNGKNWRSGLPQQFCSEYCYKHSELRSIQSKEQEERTGNPWTREEVKKKIKQTKLERYGDENYNNPKQNKKTMMEKYGVPYGVYLPSAYSNGKTISKPQKKVYNYLKTKYKTSDIEHYLSDIDLSVDIYISEKNLVVEVYGDFWHCNPIKYNKSFIHPFIKKTAREIWNNDDIRENIIKSKYKLIRIWESEVKNGKYKLLF